MNFYEFNNYEYYGLVLAINEEEAKRGYEDVIADIDESERELSPDIITEEEALEKYKKAEIDGLITEGEKIKDFKETVKNFNKYTSKSKEPFIVLLIDGYLL